uniref:Uncharacterized protein n=1 Tax=Arundo donax TaxID=35708 RepID=A0A0A9F6K3_ARUDO
MSLLRVFFFMISALCLWVIHLKL